jgi:hypothetical protein
VAAERIAANLAFINWTVLTALAVGASAAVAVARTQTDATRGFAMFTAASALAFGLLALASDGALPTAVAGSPVTTDSAWDVPRRVALIAFTVLTAADVVSLLRRRPVPWLPVAATVAGVAVLTLAALAWGGGALNAVPLFIQFAVLAAATGGVFAAMILGHWYLVTPKLSERPLILFGRLLTAVIAIQLALFVAWVATGAGPAGSGPFAVLVGPWAVFVWLRLIVGLVFPLIVSWAAIQTARSRSMESATGLLYIGVGSIAAGTILAAGLYFGAGLLV